MGLKPSLSIAQRSQIVTLWQEKYSYRQIRGKTGFSICAIQLAITNFKKSGSFIDKQRSGRPRKTTAQDDRQIVRLSKCNRRLTTPEIRLQLLRFYGIQVSTTTIKRRLHDANMNGRLARRKPLISRKNRLHRKAWCRERKNWSATKWNQIIWSDESLFYRCGNDVRQWVRRRPGEEFDPNCTVPTIKGGGGKVTVWGCITSAGPGPIKRIDGTMDQHVYRGILENTLQPWIKQRFRRKKWVFQHDNDPKHKAKSVQEWLRRRRWDVSDWPAQSPDLNPIEHCWSVVDKSVRIEKPKNVEELWQVVEKAWKNLDPQYCNKLVLSMNNRCEAVLSNCGYATRY